MKGLFCYFTNAAILALFITQTSFAQENTFLNTKVIDSFMLNKQIQKADSALTSQLAYIHDKSLNDSLFKYAYYVGKIELQKSNAKTASKKADAFLEYITSKTSNQRTYFRALLKLADFYDEIGNNQKSLEITNTALKAIKKVSDATPEEIGKIEYNIGVTYLALGNLDQAKTNLKKALQHFESYKLTAKTQLSDGYNAVGATMWMSSKLDSAKYYYSNAVKAIESAKGDPNLNLYLATVIKSNVSLLEYTEGNLAEAVSIQNEVIANYEKSIQNCKDENIVSKARRFQARAITNMAVFYNEQGNLQKAHDILLYAYQKKKKSQEASDSDLGSTLIQIGQSSLSLQDYDEAVDYLLKGLKHFETNAIENPYWKAAGLHAMAEANAAKNNSALAKNYYEKSERYFKEALGDEYDTEFLSFLRNKALFLVENKAGNEALETAQTGYDYILKNGGDDNFALVKQMLNLAVVNYKLKNYDKTLDWVSKANHYLDKTTTAADSMQTDFNKPQLILLKSMTQYELQPTKSVAFLKEQLQDLDKATTLLENRKTTVFKNEDLAILMADYQAISNTSKKIALKLYQKTKEPIYLDKIIETNEAAVYNRIRTRLNLKNNMSFIDIPTSVLDRETQLKNNMTSTLDGSEDIQEFLNVEKDWHIFLDSLKTEYPKYHKMRYATIEQPVKDLQHSIANQTTLIRYLEIDDALYAIIINKTEKHIVRLNPKNLKNDIQALADGVWDIEATSQLLHQLYKTLWQPFEDKITTQNVTIIPNGQLFNLSFESLTPKKISKFSDMTTNSLLAKYAISYNYSLLLANNTNSNTIFNDNFIGFAPEFSSKMKENYELAITDSVSLDCTYLTLLPQPFSKSLSQSSSKLFKGESFTNENASKQIFTHNAKEHKIIHIGTHAESNNVSPELSRLIFAKNVKDSISAEDNSLYTYEIYNQNLSSNLAILTACETGKPTYQAGEGMISLAHAFNYAGSESILTSLWKIDEQSSAAIVKNFYGYIKDGIPKDKALQKAKLDYIATAKGRTLAPQYWAGLVLIGDTAPIELKSSSNIWFWILGALVVIGLAIVVFRRKRV